MRRTPCRLSLTGGSPDSGNSSLCGATTTDARSRCGDFTSDCLSALSGVGAASGTGGASSATSRGARRVVVSAGSTNHGVDREGAETVKSRAEGRTGPRERLRRAVVRLMMDFESEEIDAGDARRSARRHRRMRAGQAGSARRLGGDAFGTVQVDHDEVLPSTSPTRWVSER